MIILYFILSVIVLFLIVNKIFNNFDKKAWRKNPKLNLDNRIHNYNDEERKQIDGKHYIEGKYWILESYYDNSYWYCHSKNKSIIRFAARYCIKFGLMAKIFSSNEPYGKLILDRSHGKRFVKSKRIYYTHEY